MKILPPNTVADIYLTLYRERNLYVINYSVR